MESPAGSSLLFSPIGVAAVMSLALMPVATVLMVLGLRDIDPAQEEAARLVAPPWRVVCGILLPVARPSALLSMLVVFTLAFSELGVPMFLGVRVYPGAVLARLAGSAYAPGEAAFFVLPLLLVTWVLVLLERWLFEKRPVAVLGLRRDAVPPFALEQWRTAATVAAWVLVVIGSIPLIGLGATAAHADLTSIRQWMGAAAQNSLFAAAVAATAMTIVGVVIGHALARGKRLGRVVDVVAVLAFVAPAPLLGVGLITVWNRPPTQAVYATMAIVIVGYVARYAVIAIRTFAAAAEHTPASMEEAATLVGASYLNKLRRIVLPLSARGAVTAFLLAFVFCLRDLETAVMYYPPGGEPLTVRIMTLEANGPEAIVAALAVIHVLLTAAVILCGALLIARRTR